jgi:small subunit ribosomal protein S14
LAKKSQVVRANRKPKFPVRGYHRCKVCGRSRSYYRLFALCRICFRKYALEGKIPGVTKSSW